MKALIHVGGVCALVGGTLRVGSAFIPYAADSAPLEALYAAIDITLLFALIAVYLANADAVGGWGLAFFIVALAALASIVGPDTTAFGVDFYQIGAAVFALALAGLSIQLLRARAAMIAAGLWIACAVLGVYRVGGIRGDGERARLHGRGCCAGPRLSGGGRLDPQHETGPGVSAEALIDPRSS